MLKIWGREDSLSVQKVMWCIRELDIPYEQINLGKGYDSPNQPWYLKMNPTGTIPTIDDDGFILWESNAIVKYLCAKHSPGNLSPTDPHEYADADRWISWQGTTLWPPMRQILLTLVRMPEDQARSTSASPSWSPTVTEHWTVLERPAGRPQVHHGRALHDGRHRVRAAHLPLVHLPDPAAGACRTCGPGTSGSCTHKHYRPRFTAGDVVTGVES